MDKIKLNILTLIQGIAILEICLYNNKSQQDVIKKLVDNNKVTWYYIRVAENNNRSLKTKQNTTSTLILNKRFGIERTTSFKT